jgi:hypothetical protein
MANYETPGIVERRGLGAELGQLRSWNQASDSEIKHDVEPVAGDRYTAPVITDRKVLNGELIIAYSRTK